MEITVVRALYFSGTGTTEKVVCTLAKALGRYLGASVERFDFTRPEAREAEQRFGPGELAVIGYAGLCRPGAQSAAEVFDGKAARQRRSCHSCGIVWQPQLR